MHLWWCMWVWQEAGCALEEVDGELRRQEAEGRALSIRYTYNNTDITPQQIGRCRDVGRDSCIDELGWVNARVH